MIFCLWITKETLASPCFATQVLRLARNDKIAVCAVLLPYCAIPLSYWGFARNRNIQMILRIYVLDTSGLKAFKYDKRRLCIQKPPTFAEGVWGWVAPSLLCCHCENRYAIRGNLFLLLLYFGLPRSLCSLAITKRLDWFYLWIATIIRFWQT